MELSVAREPAPLPFYGRDFENTHTQFFSSNMKAIFYSLLFLIATDAMAQTDTVWKHNMIASLNLSEVNFTHWAAGGTNSLAYLAGINGKSVRDDATTTTTWSNTYKLTYGQTKLEGQDIRKTDDEINLESMLIYKLGVHLNPYVAASLLTQFTTGYKYPDSGGRIAVSDFFDPGYLKQSAGIGWTLSKAFNTRLGLALREIITSQYNQYAAEPNETEVKKVRIDGGLESVTEVELPVDDNVVFRAKADLFDPFNHLNRLVLHGDAALIAKVSKVFSAQLTALFINEPDVSPYTQIKQGLSIGISYALM